MDLIDFAAIEPAAPRRAIVIGASMAGLLAARVLVDHYDDVLLLDRDDLPTGNDMRKATPHTRHAHALLARGQQEIERLLPGISRQWLADGAEPFDLQSGLVFFAGRKRFAQANAGIEAYAASRALLEGCVRRAVLALPRVRACAGVDVRGLFGEGGRVSGVLAARARTNDPAAALAAALVVDASGRASRTPQWLRSLGFDAPQEERVTVDIRYATAYLRRRPHHAGSNRAVACAATADCPRPAALIAQEGGRWVLTLGGYGDDAPPLDRAGFVARALTMPAPEIGAVVRDAEFLCEPFAYRFAHSQRRRYERLARFPQGLLAVGDAVCSFNPVYGQGMSVAACEAQALDRCLRDGDADLPWRFFGLAAEPIDVAWTTAVGADLAIDSVQGARPLSVRLLNRYMARLFEAAQFDRYVARSFLDVAQLLARPSSLLRPALLWRVWHGPKRRAAGPGRATIGQFTPT